MTKKADYQYGIKYRVIKMERDKYILVPMGLEKGYETETGFETEKGIIHYADSKRDLKNKFVIDTIFSSDELQSVYNYEQDDDFLSEYFYDDLRDTILYIDTGIEDGIMTKSEIDLRTINEENDIMYFMNNSYPSILLNEKALNDILKSSDLDEIKLSLNRYKRSVRSFKSFHEKKGVTRVTVENGEVKYIEVNRGIDKKININVNEEKEEKKSLESDISYRGLKNYLKERIFGHDEEIDTFAQKLYMNYTADKGETVESILLVGPTGVGKTETVKAACEYLDIPSFEINASNIVPQGIKGMSIEDVIIGLYEQADYDLEKAERGLIFLDEFDKLNDSDLDIKAAVKNILLTFTAGGKFPIDDNSDHFIFDSSMTTKVYAGVFDRIMKRKKVAGFNAIQEKAEILTAEEIRKRIISEKYFTSEELTRITTILGFNDLDRKTKKSIVLNSKLSEFIKKRNRYKRQFGIDLITDEKFVDAIIDKLSEEETGMRNINNYVKKVLDEAEKTLLENEDGNYKKLVLTKNTVEDRKNFDLV